MLSIKNEIDKLIHQYQSLNPIIYTKNKTIGEDGNVSVKENYVTAAQHFGFKNDEGGYDFTAAEVFIKTNNQILVHKLLSLTKVILKEINKYAEEKESIKDFEQEKEAKDNEEIFAFCFEKLVENMVISPYDTIEYELLKDKEGDILGAKLIQEGEIDEKVD